MVSSVMRPAGSITQTARGLPSAFTRSASDPAAVAPSFAKASRALALVSNTAQWCPAFMSRRTILPPMRPKPIMPSCIGLLPIFRLCQRVSNGVLERCQAGGDVRAEMDAQEAPVAFGQHFEVAARLRRLDDAKGVFLIRHLQIGGVIAGDLQEHAAIWAAFVGLPGRMQEPRPKAKTGGDVLAIADQHPE